MSEQTSSKAAGKRYGLAVRLLGLLCIMLACSSALAIGLFGAGMLSGFVLASAMGGLVVPALLAAADPLDALLAVLQLIWESVATLLEAITDLIGSLFG